mmetsp:Transcript_24679/g.59513  ORF Transcript_24679/g.59513 Transcript_24679/m.59513 type:complete len:141 (+) Transcript_24679:211-633(+)
MDETAIKVPTTVVSTASKVHPILKRDPHHKPGGGASTDNAARAAASSSGGNDNMTSSTTPGKEDRHLTWDEHAIEEHDQLRGTRMKVSTVCCAFIVTCFIHFVFDVGVLFFFFFNSCVFFHVDSIPLFPAGFPLMYYVSP